MMHYNKNNVRDGGFTIVELMIALAVFSVLLLICTLVLMGLGKSYVEGNNKILAENTARNIINDISNQLMLGGSNPLYAQGAGDNHGTVCIGTTRYSYIIGRQVESNPQAGLEQTHHALWRDTMKGGGFCSDLYSKMQMSTPGYTSPTDPSSDSSPGVELIPQDMRLTEFQINSIPTNGEVGSGLYNISVGVAYGDNDLLCDTGQEHDCRESWISDSANTALHEQHLQDPSGKIKCVAETGNQFCSVSYLSVTVARRLTGE